MIVETFFDFSAICQTEFDKADVRQHFRQTGLGKRGNFEHDGLFQFGHHFYLLSVLYLLSLMLEAFLSGYRFARPFVVPLHQLICQQRNRQHHPRYNLRQPKFSEHEGAIPAEGFEEEARASGEGGEVEEEHTRG